MERNIGRPVLNMRLSALVDFVLASVAIYCRTGMGGDGGRGGGDWASIKRMLHVSIDNDQLSLVYFPFSLSSVYAVAVVAAASLFQLFVYNKFFRVRNKTIYHVNTQQTASPCGSPPHSSQQLCRFSLSLRPSPATMPAVATLSTMPSSSAAVLPVWLR